MRTATRERDEKRVELDAAEHKWTSEYSAKENHLWIRTDKKFRKIWGLIKE